MFAGAGGLSLGFAQTGKFRIVAAAENNPFAQATFSENHRDVRMIPDVKGCDFKQLNSGLGGIDIVIGGPPCQGFSNANRQKKSIVCANNSLVREFFRAIQEIRPLAFVMENVTMLRSNTHRFYDTFDDHNEGWRSHLESRVDAISIFKHEVSGVDLMALVQDRNQLKQALLPERLYSCIRMLNKKKRTKGLEKFLQKNDASIINQIEAYLEGIDICSFEFNAECLTVIQDGLSRSQHFSRYARELEELVEYQSGLLIAQEIYDSHLICEFEHSTAGGIVARVHSYAVIDYINAVLGDEYQQTSGTLNARWFGVPQERLRYVTIGVRSDLVKGQSICLPEEPSSIPMVTVADAISDLEECEASYRSDAPGIIIPQAGTPISRYAQSLRYDGLLYNHVITKSTAKVLERFHALKEGENFHNLPLELINSYSKPERTQNTIYLRLDNEKWARTVVNVRKSMWIHPTLDRAISVREAARLQSFPDDFVFEGTKDSQYQQVGNAVPPMMAKAIAEILFEYLSQVR
jgi:DNA (cytosine-5)-methyltransferase 1